MKKLLFAVTALCLLLFVCGCSDFEERRQHTTHDFRTVVVAPTCIDEGYTKYICKKCIYSYEDDFVPADPDGGHNYVDYVCTVCDNFLADEAVYNTSSLQFVKCTDGSGVYYEVTGASADCVYIKIPSTYNDIPVKEIRSEAFSGLLNLKHVILPKGLEIIEKNAFASCLNLTGIDVPDSVVSIEDHAFENCQKLKSISLGSITEISDGLFGGCVELENIVIPDGVTTIGSCAFHICFSLTSVTIPASVTKIIHGAFENSSRLKDIFYNGTKEQWHNIDKEAGYYTNGNDASWDAYTGDYVVHCSDGDIPKSQANL